MLIDAAEERQELCKSLNQLKLKETRKIQKTITVKQSSPVLDELTVREGAFVTPSMNLMTLLNWIKFDLLQKSLRAIEPVGAMTFK